MSKGVSYIHALSPVIVRYSSTGMITARCPLVHPPLKWSDFTPTRIPAIYYSMLLMPSCLISPTIRVTFSFFVLIVYWTEMAVSV